MQTDSNKVAGMGAPQESVRDVGLHREESRVILDSLVEHVIYLDLDFIIRWANTSACRAIGRGREEVIGRKCREIWRKNHIVCDDCVVQHAKLTGRTCGKEKTMPDGRVWHVQGNPVRSAAGEIIGLTEIALDITEWKKTEQELKQSHQLLESILNTIPVRVFWKDRDLEFMGCNRLLAEDIGLTSPGEIVGKTDFDFIHRDRAEHYQADDRAVIETGIPKLNIEEELTRPDGTQMWLRTNKVPLRDHKDRIIGVLGTFEDCTSQKQAEALLQGRLDKLICPDGDLSAVSFNDLFDLEEIQRIQDAFAQATGVASIITDPTGKPITRPSNFCRLCRDIIRPTEKGLANCMHSDAELGKPKADGPRMQPCLSGGLWDGGASIMAGDRHIANWLIGQVRNEEQDEESMLAYAREIGADEDAFRRELAHVVRMSREQFAAVCHCLFLYARQLSQQAYKNLQQARYIIERKKAEDSISESERKLAALMKNLPGMAYRCKNDRRWTMEFISEGSLSLTGYEADNLVEKDPVSYYDLIHPDDIPGIASRIEQALEYGTSFEIEYRIRTKTGDTKWVWEKGSGLYSGFGEAVAIEGFINDITCRIDAEEMVRQHNEILEATVRQRTEDLREAMVEAEEANMAKSTFLANMSHELRTPLHGILSFAGFGLTRWQKLEPATLAEFFEKIQESGQTLLYLLNDLLDLAKLESGKMTFEFAPAILAAHIQSVTDEFRSLLSEKQIEVKFINRSGRSDKMTIDAEKIRQVQRNLISNAVKFSPPGSTIYVDIEYDEDVVRVSVIDEGSGIPEGELELVFDQFVQSSKTKSGSGGTGLGLAICKEIVTGHQGRIWAENTEEGGARFVYELPLTAACDERRERPLIIS